MYFYNSYFLIHVFLRYGYPHQKSGVRYPGGFFFEPIYGHEWHLYSSVRGDFGVDQQLGMRAKSIPNRAISMPSMTIFWSEKILHFSLDVCLHDGYLIVSSNLPPFFLLVAILLLEFLEELRKPQQ